MKLVNTYEEYLTLLKQKKQNIGKLIMNSYLSADKIERYINLHRLYYVEQEKGIVFLCDEEKYYRLLYYMGSYTEFEVPKTDKPIAIRNIYKEGNKKGELIFLEEQLEKIGFRKEYVAVEMCVPLEQSANIARQKTIYERMLKKGKFYIGLMKKENVDKMLLLRETKEFHMYNFEYKTQEEYFAEIDNDQYLAIYNEDDEMCACIYTEQLPGAMTGDGICVEEKYRKTYGLGAALMCFVLDQALNQQKKRYVSWCEIENTNSMKFHKSIGFETTGKISEEWILE